MKTIPSPLALPIIGNLPQVFMHDNFMDLFLHYWEKYGDIFMIKLGGQNLVVVAHPEGIEKILSTNRTNYIKGAVYDSIRILVGDGLLTLEGHAWKKRRALAQPSFHKKSIQLLTNSMIDATDRTLKQWKAKYPSGSIIDLHTEMVALTLNIASEALFGQKLVEEIAEKSGSAFMEALELTSKRGNAAIQIPLSIPTPENIRIKKALKVIDELTYYVINSARATVAEKQKNEEPVSSLLEMLIISKDAETGEPLKDDELKDEVITLFLAGHETTALLMSWGYYLLGKEKANYKKLEDEIETVLKGKLPTFEDLKSLVYTGQIVDELLRMRPPVYSVGRNAIAGDEICGFEIKPNDVVLPMQFLLHHHPKYWDSPEKFDPDRFSPEKRKKINKWVYFPFSRGPRICIGEMFSLVEAKIVLAMISQQLDFELLSQKVRMDPMATLRPKDKIEIKLNWKN